jgi:hypothetical protein
MIGSLCGADSNSVVYAFDQTWGHFRSWGIASNDVSDKNPRGSISSARYLKITIYDHFSLDYHLTVPYT